MVLEGSCREAWGHEGHVITTELPAAAQYSAVVGLGDPNPVGRSGRGGQDNSILYRLDHGTLLKLALPP
jgi:hypothetical protein